MEVAFDTDPKQGIETRIKVMDMLAAQRMLTLVYHLPCGPAWSQGRRRVPLCRGPDASRSVGRRNDPSTCRAQR